MPSAVGSDIGCLRTRGALAASPVLVMVPCTIALIEPLGRPSGLPVGFPHDSEAIDQAVRGSEHPSHSVVSVSRQHTRDGGRWTSSRCGTGCWRTTEPSPPASLTPVTPVSGPTLSDDSARATRSLMLPPGAKLG